MSTPSDESIARFFMDEGCATFVVSQRKESKGLMSILGYRISPRIAVVNTAEILVPLQNWLRLKKINFLVTVQQHGTYRPLTIIRIERFEDAKRFLHIMLPYLLGRKKSVCKLMLECLLKYGGRENWSDIMREKVVRDKRTGRILTIDWNAKEERQRFLGIMKYRDKILAINGGFRSKYNYAFFLKLWGMKDVNWESSSC